MAAYAMYDIISAACKVGDEPGAGVDDGDDSEIPDDVALRLARLQYHTYI